MHLYALFGAALSWSKNRLETLVLEVQVGRCDNQLYTILLIGTGGLLVWGFVMDEQ
jgi:hypothetical protein